MVALLVVGACRSTDAPELVAATLEAEPTPEAEAEPTPEAEAKPEAKLEPTPDPTPTPTPAGWLPIDEPEFIQSELVRGDAETATYALERAKSTRPLRYRLELRAGEDGTDLRLIEPDSGHVLDHGWPSPQCSYQFYDGDGPGAALGEIARDERGRALLELWVTCFTGEDIRFVESLMLLVLADADGLSLLWSGETSAHTSHVCGEWSQIEVSVEPPQLVISESEHGAIFEPESVPDYDCENAREYATKLGQTRLALP